MRDQLAAFERAEEAGATRRGLLERALDFARAPSRRRR